MEWANNNSTGAENIYIHSQFASMLSISSAQSFQEEATVDASPHQSLCSQICTPSKTTHYFCRKELSSLEQDRQKNPLLNLPVYKTPYVKIL